MISAFNLESYSLPKEKRLSDREMKKLIKRYQKTRKEELREAIIKNSLYMINQVVKESRKNKENYEDDYQAGVIGMLKAIENYDPERGVQWNTFAVKCIKSAVSREYKQRTKEKTAGCSVHGLEQEGVSLENLLANGNDTEEEVISREFARQVAANAKNILTNNELIVLEQVYGINGKEKKTYKQIAEQLGRDQSTLRTQVERAIKKIRKEYKGV